MYRLIAILVLLAASAQAQSVSLTNYVKAQLPSNTNRQITPVNVQNAVLAYPNNVYVDSKLPISTTSYVTATTYYGDGSHLTGVVGGSSTTPGGISTSVQVNNGTTNSLYGDSFFTYIAGLLQAPSISATNVSVTGPISASTYYGDGSHLTGISAGSSNYNSLTNIPTVLANISNSTGSVTVTSINASMATLTSIGAGSLTASGIVSANTLDAFFISGTQVSGITGLFPGGVTIGNGTSNVVITGGNVSATGLLTAPTTSGTYGYFTNISGTNVVATNGTFTNVAGTLSTAAQPNITSLGSLTSLTVSGPVTATGGLLNTANISATGNLSVTTINGAIPVFGGAPSWYTVTSIPTVIQNISNSTGSVTVTSVAANTSGTNVNALNVSATNLYLTSTTLLAGQSLYVRNSNGLLLVDGSAGYQYDFNTDNSIFSSTDIPAATTPSATVHVSGTLRATGQSTLANVSVTAISGNGSQLTGLTDTFISTTQNAAGNISGSFGVGPNALVGTGVSNTSVGAYALNGNTTGHDNTAMGAHATYINQTGNQNTAIGSESLASNNSSNGNTALGAQSLQSTTQFFNTGIGLSAAQSLVTGTQNTAIGSSALINMQNGGNNVGIGNQAGIGFISGTNNIAIGQNTSFTATTGSNQLTIGNVVYGDLRPNLVGRIGINTVSPTAALEVSGTISGTALAAPSANITTLTVGSCSGCGAGGGSSISTTTFTAASNISQSTAVGVNAYAVGTGTFNTVYGSGAGVSSTTGSSNTLVGARAGSQITTALRNTAFGAGALQKNITNADMTAVGYQALWSLNNTATNSTAVGSGALFNFSPGSGQSEDAFGFHALNALSDGTANAAFGTSALAGISSAAGQNTAVGNSAGSALNSSSSNNVIIGASAASSGGGTANQNVVVGRNALLRVTTGSTNTALGDQVASNLTTGTANTLIGVSAASSLTTGGSNIIIGAGVNTNSATVSNSLNIGNAISGNIGSGTGNTNLIGVNVTSSTSAFEVSGTVAFDNIAAAAGLDYMCYSSATGQVTYSLTTCTVSDRKFKTNIAPYNNSLATVMAMQVREFDFKNPTYGKGKQVGLIAQEVQPIAPNLVSAGSNGDLSVDYAKLSAYNTGAIQVLQHEINELRQSQGLPPLYTTFWERLEWLAGY